MGIKLIFLIGAIAMFMDPCDKKPRNIELREVGEACSTEAGRMFVRVTGRMQRADEFVCKDQPGGRRCEVVITTEAGGDPLTARIRGTEKRDGQIRFESSLVGPKGISGGSTEPYSVGFDDVELYDRNGSVVDHANGTVSFSGSLQQSADKGGCWLQVLRVENKEANQ